MSIPRTAVASMLILAFSAGGRTFAGDYSSLRIHDDGAFQVWNGIDAEARGERTLVLAVIGTHKSVRIHYAPDEPAPAVRFGPGWADIVAGNGTAVSMADSDCHPGLILYCTNEPIRGVPPGTIVCMCTRGNPDNECCEGDTGFYTKTPMWTGTIP